MPPWGWAGAVKQVGKMSWKCGAAKAAVRVKGRLQMRYGRWNHNGKGGGTSQQQTKCRQVQNAVGNGAWEGAQQKARARRRAARHNSTGRQVVKYGASTAAGKANVMCAGWGIGKMPCKCQAGTGTSTANVCQQETGKGNRNEKKHEPQKHVKEKREKVQPAGKSEPTGHGWNGMRTKGTGHHERRENEKQ